MGILRKIFRVDKNIASGVRSLTTHLKQAKQYIKSDDDMALFLDSSNIPYNRFKDGGMSWQIKLGLHPVSIHMSGGTISAKFDVFHSDLNQKFARVSLFISEGGIYYIIDDSYPSTEDCNVFITCLESHGIDKLM